MKMIRSTIPLVALTVLAGCELSPKVSQQTGYRGTGMDQIHTVAALDKAKAANFIPPAPYPLESRDGPLATSQYQNVKVLNDLSADEFNRLMGSFNDWVAPKEEGCNYCHNPENMASDEKYQKIVARRMIEMTRHINTEWQPHVKQTGVTCWTCHRGNALPTYKWSSLAPEPAGIRGNRHGQNAPNKNVGYASLPNNIYEPYLLASQNVRVESPTAYGKGGAIPIQSAEQTYGLMMRVSTALGVNCTYCHNTNGFASWTHSTPARVTAWHGIRLARDINNAYLQPLGSVLPASQKGSLGDAYKVNCATCHQGVNKPLGGVSMLKDHPALAGPRSAAMAATAPATAGAGVKTGAR
ncbi:photosynthetic reaction center cytochrome PufC [Aquisediminimonas profunda]|uniref:photosynthetic reaction center cytochrome PufC n=1 Tax=Aquisediminimonas profunda TaxID=1550733 RepID=UPI001C635DF7|nr:photosynthetic reaction center cytochrome PufC [Aquisediminimonas profunda]